MRAREELKREKKSEERGREGRWEERNLREIKSKIERKRGRLGIEEKNGSEKEI